MGHKKIANESNSKITAIILFFILFSFTDTHAQQPIELNAAIDTALKNNLIVKNEKLNAEYQKKLTAAGTDIPQTYLSGEYGKINSFYNDNKIGIAQTISFPTVYSRQKLLQNERYRNSLMNVAVKESELKKQVSEVFYLLVYLQQKIIILTRNDSLYTGFLEKANLRFAAGETNILEKTTAETQRGQIAMQLNELKSGIEILHMKFQLLLNSKTRFTPLAESSKINFNSTLDTSAVEKHPIILELEQQNKIALANTKLERSRLLPNMNAGFSTMTMQGNGADNVFYQKSTRFNSFQFGIGMPLFFGAQKAKINSSKTLQLISTNNYLLGLQTLRNEYETTFKQYLTQSEIVKYFEDDALKKTTLITKIANQQFDNGDINYLEWVMLINNAITIQTSYTDAVNDLNQTIIKLNYLTNK